MTLTPLAVTAITNFMLACEAFFIAGLLFATPKTPRSAAWLWQLGMLTLATSALVGGIDHGFFELFGQTAVRKGIEHSNWFLLGLLTLFVFLTAAQQFLTPPVRRIATIIAFVQLAVYTILILTTDTFQVVILNYAPIMLLMLILNVRGLRQGTGSWAMIGGIVVSFAASGVQAAHVDVFSPVDRNGLYHIGMMGALVLFYAAGKRLKTG